MTLQVPFEDFLATARRFEMTEAYARREDANFLVSACNPRLGVVLQSMSAKNFSEVKKALEGENMALYRGGWCQETLNSEVGEAQIYVAAVSYQTSEPTPGIWVDAYPHEPNHVQVLQAIYEEFRHTGEMPEVTIEEFIRNANPSVVVVAESALRQYVEAKQVQDVTAR
jgi:hypothetical protein